MAADDHCRGGEAVYRPRVYKAGSEDADSGTWNGKTDILQREIEYSRSLGCDGIMLYSWDYMDTSQTQEEVANVIKIFQEGSGN